MKIIDRLKDDKIHISFEVFPPKTDDGFEKVLNATDRIAKLHPAFISVTSVSYTHLDVYKRQTICSARWYWAETEH